MAIRGSPRTQYERTYVLVPPNAGTDYVNAVIQATWDKKRYTVGGSADDAGIGDLNIRRVIALNPEKWTGNLKAFFEEHYPGIEYVPMTGTLAEIVYKLGGAYVLWMKDPRWRDTKIAGTVCTKTIGQMGCYITNVAMAQKHYGLRANPTPLTVNTELGVDGYSGCDALWSKIEQRCGLSVSGCTQTDVNNAVVAGKVAMLKVPLGSIGHWVLVVARSGNDYIVHDPMYGDCITVKSRYASYLGWRALTPASSPAPVPSQFPLLGLYDRAGGEYLASRGVKGWCVEPVYLGDNSKTLDFSGLAQAGVRVIANLRYSYAVRDGGLGTIPKPDKWSRFTQSIRDTIKNARGVWAFTLFNEANNFDEWPRGYDVKVGDLIHLYNEVWKGLPSSAKVGPGALDPFHGQTGSVMDWWLQYLNGITGAHVIDVHGYTRGPDPARIDDPSKFQHAPMQWQFLNYFGCIKTLLDKLPARFANLSVLITEFNHLWQENLVQPPEPTIGWSPTATDVIQAAYDRARKDSRVIALVMFRYDYIMWRMSDKPALLHKVVSLNSAGQ